MIRALVTGGVGFIGQNLVSELVSRGRLVRVLDIAAPARALPMVEYVEGSVLDCDCVRYSMADIDEVYHLAGLPGMWKRNRVDFHVVNFIGTETVLGIARQYGVARFLHCSTESILFRPSRPVDLEVEQAVLSAREMPGPYTRSKMLADRLALEAAASGFPVVVGCPTMPIGPYDPNLTPPTAMLQRFLGGGPVQLYLDFIVNLVDVRDVAIGLILAMEKGRIGHRYLLGGDSVRLREVLALIASINGRRKLLIPVPNQLAELVASVIEFKANYLTGRTPSATAEGVRIARRATALSIEKARQELGYEPRAIEPVLRETIVHMMGAGAGKALKYA
jgi:dihydroflavonol-4-reductase